MKARLIAIAAAVVMAAAPADEAFAGSCGNGYCEVGEDAGNCSQDCQCYNTASVDYALCCCCMNDPAPQGDCTPKAVCNFPEIGGCCCAQFDPFDPFTCLFCVDKEEIPGWCSGGIGAYEGSGTCGGGQPTPTCDDTELTDDYVGMVDVRTRCATTVIPMGTVDGGAGLSLDVSIVYNEGRPVPAEIADGVDAFGVGGWLTVDQIVTDEGVYWSSTNAAGERQPRGVVKGTRGDANENGYVGYTLHTPFGSRTYDYPVVLKAWSFLLNPDKDYKSRGVFRSEPFDGWFLLVEDTGGIGGVQYTRFRYPSGPFEVYKRWLKTLADGGPGPGALKTARLLGEVRASFMSGQTGQSEPNDRKWIVIGRGVDKSIAVTYGVWSALGWSVYFDFKKQPDGSRIVQATRKPFDLAYKATITPKAGNRVETYTQPGRQSDGAATLTWDDWRIASIESTVNDKAKAAAFKSVTTVERAKNAVTVEAIKRADTLKGVALGDHVTRFGTCDVNGAAISGTRVLFPRDVSMSYEYGDEDVGYRLVAQTDPTGVRTEYVYNDWNKEPRFELTDAAYVAKAGDPVADGLGQHIEWQWLEQSPIDKNLFPQGTFVNAVAASKGIPKPKQITRLPDGMPVRTIGGYDTEVLLPTSIRDEHRHLHELTYYSDTAQVKSYTRAGLQTKYLRTQAFSQEVIESVMVGQNGVKDASLGRIARTKFGFIGGETFTGTRLDSDALPQVKYVPITIEKRIEYSDKHGGLPFRVRTYVDGKVQQETTVNWDERAKGVGMLGTSFDGTAIASVTPAAGGTVDGMGSAVGEWNIEGLGMAFAMKKELDPLGGIQSAIVNGTGVKLEYAKGSAPSALLTEVTAVAPDGDTPMFSTEEIPGETEEVCQ